MEHQLKTIHSDSKRPYFLWFSIILFIFLFYKQEVGFNLFLMYAALVSSIVVYNASLLRKTNALILTVLLGITTASAAWFGDEFSCIFSVFLFLGYPFVLFDWEQKLVFVPIKGIWNVFFNSFTFFALPLFPKSSSGTFTFQKVMYYIVIPVIFLILFVFVYQFINEDFNTTFKEITDFDFNIELIAFCVLSFFIMVNFWFADPERNLLKTDLNAITQEQFSAKEQEQFATKNKSVLFNSGIIVMSLLSVLLALLLYFDVAALLQGKEMLKKLNYSTFVHEGVQSVIISIVLAVVIICFYFYAELNFYPKKTLRYIVTIWLILNVLLLATTFIKNDIYIDSYGLTLKRLGVIAFLLLSLVGIAFTLIKIWKHKTTYFLFNKMLWVFIIFGAAICPVNWSSIITNHNISAYKNSQIDLDLDYLYSLGDYNYVPLMEFENERENLQSQKTIIEDKFDYYTRYDTATSQQNITQYYHENYDYRSTAFYYDWVYCNYIYKTK